MKLAPITLFVYNRPWHTKQTIEALKKNRLAKDSELFIFSDGPENENSKETVRETREYIKTINGFKKVEIVEREKNLGLANSIISGVSKIVDQYGRIIVLEDDMISSRYFLKYMNDALNLYEEKKQVISIHAYVYPTKKILPETYFLKGADCWGWATWKRGWDLFESDGQKLLQELEIKKLTKEFDFDGSYPYTKMLKDQIAGKNNSWAIRWYASAFLKNKLTLYPGKSLVDNIGLDGSGTHCNGDNNFGKKNQIKDLEIEVKKIDIKESLEARLAVIDFLKRESSLWIRGFKYFKMILKKYASKN